MANSIAIGAGVFVVVTGLLLMVILMPLSFHRVAFDEVAISYDKVSRKLGDEVKREGLHNLGPSGSLIRFKITQQNANIENLKALTQDGMELYLDVQVAYTVIINDVRAIIEEFADQDNHDAYIRVMCESVVRDSAVKFTARSFYLQREDFQSAVFTDISRQFSDNSVHANVNIVQVLNIELPRSVEDALQNTTVSEQDVQNALTERSQAVQEAQIRLNLTRQESDLLLLNAQRDVDRINQDSLQAVLAERNRILQRTYAFSNISAGLGLGGNFFVESYLKALVTQTNRGKTIIGL